MLVVEDVVDGAEIGMGDFAGEEDLLLKRWGRGRRRFGEDDFEGEVGALEEGLRLRRPRPCRRGR